MVEPPDHGERSSLLTNQLKVGNLAYIHGAVCVSDLPCTALLTGSIDSDLQLVQFISNH